MSTPGFIEPSGLRVTVDRLVYAPQLPSPPDRPHSFVYFISIHNDMDVAVIIKARKWVVTNENGELTVVEGEGVVGEFPRIEPGEKFTYNSRHILDTRSGSAEGSYIGLDEGGRKVLTRIPRFKMLVPESAE